ncbi:MAG: hypothetical protein U0414_34110 [Polyangiaceae bacterium]
MARSDPARVTAVALVVAAAVNGCKHVDHAAAIPTFIPAIEAPPPHDDSLGTRARVVPFEPAPIDPEGARILSENYARAPVAPDDRAPPLTLEALEDTALSEARGLELEGTIHSSNLREAERSALSIELAPGECITVIAHGGLGVMEVDAFVVRPSSDPPHVLAEDSRNGPVALVGGLAGCWPFLDREPATVDVVVQARRGSGRVVYAVYASRLESAKDE